VQSPARQHPNATLGGSGGGVAVFIIWVITTYAGVPLSATQGAALATAVATVLLLFGRHGLRGLCRMLWDGFDNVTNRDDPA
jgi:hypothetical protein